MACSNQLQTQWALKDKGLQRKLLTEQKLKFRPIIRQIFLDLSKYVNILQHQAYNKICYPFLAYLACFYGKRQDVKFQYAKQSVVNIFEFFLDDLSKYPPNKEFKINLNGKAKIDVNYNHCFKLTIKVNNSKTFTYNLNLPTDKYHVLINYYNSMEHYIVQPNVNVQNIDCNIGDRLAVNNTLSNTSQTMSYANSNHEYASGRFVSNTALSTPLNTTTSSIKQTQNDNANNISISPNINNENTYSVSLNNNQSNTQNVLPSNPQPLYISNNVQLSVQNNMPVCSVLNRRFVSNAEITQQSLYNLHQRQLLNNRNNDNKTLQIVETLGGIDTILSNYLTRAVLSKQQLIQINRILCDTEDSFVTKCDQNRGYEREFSCDKISNFNNRTLYNGNRPQNDERIDLVDHDEIIFKKDTKDKIRNTSSRMDHDVMVTDEIIFKKETKNELRNGSSRMQQDNIDDNKDGDDIIVSYVVQTNNNHSNNKIDLVQADNMNFCVKFCPNCHVQVNRTQKDIENRCSIMTCTNCNEWTYWCWDCNSIVSIERQDMRCLNCRKISRKQRNCKTKNKYY